MNRPYIICHMVSSLDGKVTGKFLREPRCENATVAEAEDKPLFMDGQLEAYSLENVQYQSGSLWLNYKKR